MQIVKKLCGGCSKELPIVGVVADIELCDPCLGEVVLRPSMFDQAIKQAVLTLLYKCIAGRDEKAKTT